MLAGLVASAAGAAMLPARAGATDLFGVGNAFDTALETPWERQARLIDMARRELQRNASLVLRADRVGIIDFSQPSALRRFHLIDMEAGRVEDFHVTHGRGSDPEHDGWLKAFSNTPNSLATSRGAYRTSDYYWGKHGSSMRLVGLDPDNSNAEDRAIVVHGAWYAAPSLIAEQGKLGRSEGCFVFAEDLLPQILDRMGPGRLLFADRLG